MPGFRTARNAARDMDILVRGPVTAQDITDAQEIVRHALHAERPIDHVQVKLADYRAGAPAGCCVTQVNVDCAGRTVRGQQSGGTVAEATEQVAGELPSRLRRLEQHLAAEFGPPSFDQEAWEGRPPRSMPALAASGSHAPRLVRHKACPLARQTPDTAARTMDLRDYDFHLFVEDPSEQDAVMYRGGPTGYRLTAPAPALLAGAASSVPVDVDPAVLPVLTLPEAIRAIEAGGTQILVFVTVRTGRGAVLYRRFDGHLGVVTSAW
jgi:sigma 54 modulation/S30EA-like ribosomal protein